MITAPFLLSEVAAVHENDHVLMLNSSADAFVTRATRVLDRGMLTLAEDNIAVLARSLANIRGSQEQHIRPVAFHDYIRVQPAATMDSAALNLFYQPANAWMLYAMHVAVFALKENGSLYVVGGKDRGI